LDTLSAQIIQELHKVQHMYNFSFVFYSLLMLNKFQLGIWNCCNCRYSPYFLYLYHNRTSHFSVP